MPARHHMGLKNPATTLTSPIHIARRADALANLPSRARWYRESGMWPGGFASSGNRNEQNPPKGNQSGFLVLERRLSAQHSRRASRDGTLPDDGLFGPRRAFELRGRCPAPSRLRSRERQEPGGKLSRVKASGLHSPRRGCRRWKKPIYMGIGT